MYSRRNLILLLSVAMVSLSIGAAVVVGGALGQAGVEISPDGVFRTKLFRDPTGELTRRRLAEARATLRPELSRPSKLRKISLTRLEAALAELRSRGEFETAEMKYLAGLTRVTHVFYYPKTKDIVIAGPAEGFVESVSGRAVGMETGRAILELQDLVAALRAYPPTGDRTSIIGVSIDPTKEGLQNMQNFLSGLGGQALPRDTRRIVSGLRKSLGQQVVSLQGVSARTHFAQVLVEADYRMKLIGIGLENPPAEIKSYVSRANPRDVSRNAMLRWYFVPNYECVKVSEDELAMELVNSTVKLIGRDELVTAGGERLKSGKVDRAGRAFVESFTKHYDKLAERSPVYGQLRNLVDMSIVAAYIQRQDYYSQAGWSMEVLGSEEQFPIETYTAPKRVESAVNAIWKGRTLMTPIGGGVVVQPQKALVSNRMLQDENGEVARG